MVGWRATHFCVMSDVFCLSRPGNFKDFKRPLWQREIFRGRVTIDKRTALLNSVRTQKSQENENIKKKEEKRTSKRRRFPL